HHVVALDDLVLVDRADVLLLQPAFALGVKQVERDRRLALRRGKQLDGYRHEPERDRPRTNGASAHARDDNVPVLMKNFLDERAARRPSEDRHASAARPSSAVDRVRQELRALSTVRRRLHAAEVQPMLAEVRQRPFTDPEWVFELKYDGFRAIAGRDDGQPIIRYRRGSDATRVHPDLAAALSALPVEHALIDAEIVVLDDQGRPSFQRLQKRALLTAPRELELAARELPATLFCFDLLAFDDCDLRPLPLVVRKRLLRLLLPDAGPLRYVDHFVGRGEELFRGVRELGLEGMMAKRAASSYRAGRCADWIKVRSDHSADFAVVGFSPPEGSRSGFGSLHLAYADGNAFVYVGRAGSGFSESELRGLREELERDRVARPPCSGSLPAGRGHVWVSPRRVVEVRYKEI